MSLRSRRPRRPDAWSDAHARARFRAAERLDGTIDPTETRFLDEHLRSCNECRTAAADYAAQRLELRALGERQPVPPRDLWARTAAAIERESSFRDRAAGRRNRRSPLAPYGLLTAAVAVAMIVGVVSFRGLIGPQPVSPLRTSDTAQASAATTAPSSLAPQIAVAQKVKWITQDSNGQSYVKTATVDHVCQAAAQRCDATAPSESRPVDLGGTAQTVVGSRDGDALIVFSHDSSAQTSVSVLQLQPAPESSASPSPSVASSAPSAPASPTASPSTPETTPSPTPSLQTSGSPVVVESSAPSGSPPIDISPSPSGDGSVEIAHNVIVVGQAAAYSASGSWFAFTARPADGSAGPDIYVWHVGDPQARPITTDHRSELGSWSQDTIVGSTAVDTADGTVAAAFVIDPVTGARTMLPETGNAWRPSVDPFGLKAVYWTGRLQPRADGPGYAPDTGRLVVGMWSAATGTPTDGSSPTPPADQPSDRHETTIDAGQITDWDARWDETGTRLAVWIADPRDPSVGQLSLYAVDPFDGQVDLKKPLVDGRLAKAGFAISQGKLVWAEPASGTGADDGRILLYAWTDKGAGEVETLPGHVIVVR